MALLSTLRRVTVASALGGALLLGPRPVMATTWAPAPYEQLANEGGELIDAGDFAAGADRLASAYEQMPADLKESELGVFVVVRASDAYAQAVEAGEDPAQLQAHKDLLDAFFAEPGSVKAASTEQKDTLTERRDALEARLAEIEEADRAERDAAEAERLAAENARQGDTEPVDDGPPRAKPDGLSIGLLVGGGAVLAGGVVLAVQGGRFPGLIDDAKQEGLQEYGLEQEPSNWAAHEDDQRRVGRALLASGITLAAVGAGAVIWGSIRLAKSRKRSAETTAFVVPLRRGAGVGVSVGF